jgi:predicted transcriptional regulator
MGTVRVIAELTAKDSRAASEFVQRATAFVEATLPDTVAWEAFTDDATGRWILYEVFQDDGALVSYEQAMSREGLREEALSIFELVRVTLLTPLADPRLKEQLDQIGAIEMQPRAGFTR